jgi:copper chaperone
LNFQVLPSVTEVIESRYPLLVNGTKDFNCNEMEKIKFKTNIKCSACVAKVTPYLDEVAGENLWQVDLVDPARTLTVDNGDDKKIVEALLKAGYKAEKV